MEDGTTDGASVRLGLHFGVCPTEPLDDSPACHDFSRDFSRLFALCVDNDVFQFLFCKFPGKLSGTLYVPAE